MNKYSASAGQLPVNKRQEPTGGTGWPVAPKNLMFPPLDISSYCVKFLGIPSLLKGRCRDACSAGRDAVPEGGGLTWLFVRGSTWVSVRPHYRGLPPKLAGRGQAAARNRRAPSPRKHGPGLHHRGGTLKGVAVCLCFPAIREISRGRYPKVRLSAFRLPLFLSRARFSEPPLHVKRFAGSDDARP